MSYGARLVLVAIDQAVITYDRNPTLFAAQLRNDRDCRQLARAVEHKKNEKLTPHVRPDRDEVERIDLETEEAMARDREEHDRGRRLRFASHRREQRRSMSTLELVRSAIEEAVTISTVPAGNVEPSRGGDSAGGVPRQQQLEDDPRWQVAERIIKRQALVLHELLDEAKGLSRSAAAATLDGVEKDRAILVEGLGLIAEDVVAALGREYGSTSYVRRLRRERGLDTRGYAKVDR